MSLEAKIRQLEIEFEETKDQLNLALNTIASQSRALESANSNVSTLLAEMKEQKAELSQQRNRNNYSPFEESKTVYAESETSKSSKDEASEDFSLAKETEDYGHLSGREMKSGLAAKQDLEESNPEEKIEVIVGEAIEQNLVLLAITELQESIRDLTQKIGDNKSAKNLEASVEKLAGNQDDNERKRQIDGKWSTKVLSDLHTFAMKAGQQLDENKKKMEERREKEDFLLSLVGPYTWMKDKISIANDKVKSNYGRTFSTDEVKKAVEMNAPWMLFPEEYVVECYSLRCKREMIVSSYLCEDKVRVKCPSGHQTILEGAKLGFERVSSKHLVKAFFRWAKGFYCNHFQQIKKGTNPELCGFCGKTTRVYAVQAGLADIKMPKRYC